MARSRPRTFRVRVIPDPFHLDAGPYAKALKRIEQDLVALKDRVQDEPRHPLLKDRRITALVKRLERFDTSLNARGDMRLHDPYYEFNEGMVLRLPVIAKVILDYVLSHPEILGEGEREGR